MIGVVWDRTKTKGIDRLEEAEKVGCCEMVSMEAAMMQEWGTDAHFSCYHVVGSDSWPRLNKPAITEIRDLGGDVKLEWLALDYDLPGKSKETGWTPELAGSFLNSMEAAQEDGFDLALCWRWFYTTNGGARIIYKLSRPLSIDEFEPFYRGVIRDWAKYLDMDPSCDQWNRLFRLPRVVRGGKKTSEATHFDFVDGSEDAVLHVDTIAPGEKKLSANVAAVKFEIEQPDADDATLLVWRTLDRTKTTDLGRVLRESLKGRDCFPCIFEHRSISDEGGRDNTIQRFVGSACNLTYAIPNNSPEAVYGLFCEAVFDLEPDRQTPDWSVVLWAAVLRWWGKEAALQKTQEIEKKEEERKVQNFAYHVVSQVRKWCREPGLNQESMGDSLEWMSSRIVACAARGYFVLRPDGYYSRNPVTSMHLPARIRELGMDQLISLEVPKATGDGFRQVTAQEIINKHGTLVSNVEGAVGVPGSILTNFSDDNTTLTIQLFKHNPLVRPTFNKDVDDWLLNMAGSRWNYTQLCEWIGHALDFRGCICALSIAGPPAIGKKLLVQGLAECIDTECFADSSEFGRFQAALMRTPFLSINEGFPDFPGARHPADSFRMMITGESMRVERKFQDPVTIKNPLRVIITANNHDVVEILAGNKDLSPDDREALGERLKHFDLKNTGADWLAQRGGIRFTSRNGNRWIRGDDGQPSNYVVANHFMWLYETRNPPTGSRLLVEGDKTSSLVQSFATRSGSAPAVIECLCRMVDTASQLKGFVVHRETGRIWTTPSAIVDYWRVKMAAQSRVELTGRKVGKVLRGLKLRGTSTESRKLPPDTKNEMQARWIEIDATLLLAEAEEFGYETELLRRIGRMHYEIQVGLASKGDFKR